MMDVDISPSDRYASVSFVTDPKILCPVTFTSFLVITYYQVCGGLHQQQSDHHSGHPYQWVQSQGESIPGRMDSNFSIIVLKYWCCSRRVWGALLCWMTVWLSTLAWAGPCWTLRDRSWEEAQRLIPWWLSGYFFSSNSNWFYLVIWLVSYKNNSEPLIVRIEARSTKHVNIIRKLDKHGQLVTPISNIYF